jgi:hypothetical protein
MNAYNSNDDAMILSFLDNTWNLLLLYVLYDLNGFLE